MFKLVVLSALLAITLAAPAPEPVPAPAPKPDGILAYAAAPPVAVFHSAPLIHAPLVAHVPAAISSQYTAVYHGAKAVPVVHEAHIAAVPLAHPGLVISPMPCTPGRYELIQR